MNATMEDSQPEQTDNNPSAPNTVSTLADAQPTKGENWRHRNRFSI
jgi:hypothetical protein